MEIETKSCMFEVLKQTDMTNQKNIWNLKEGDTITFTNKVKYHVRLSVTRVEEKSCYLENGRNSWNTIATYLSYPDAKIIQKLKS